jgi:hypothetical protein
VGVAAAGIRLRGYRVVDACVRVLLCRALRWHSPLVDSLAHSHIASTAPITHARTSTLHARQGARTVAAAGPRTRPLACKCLLPHLLPSPPRRPLRPALPRASATRSCPRSTMCARRTSSQVRVEPWPRPRPAPSRHFFQWSFVCALRRRPRECALLWPARAAGAGK